MPYLGDPSISSTHEPLGRFRERSRIVRTFEASATLTSACMKSARPTALWRSADFLVSIRLTRLSLARMITADKCRRNSGQTPVKGGTDTLRRLLEAASTHIGHREPTDTSGIGGHNDASLGCLADKTDYGEDSGNKNRLSFHRSSPEISC
jgi:hypothetical protein